MAVPEAAVHENHLPSTHEDDIGFSRQIGAMKPVAITAR